MLASYEAVEALVVGAGHAGLSTSYYLTQARIPHIVLERGRIGETWRSNRWDSFTLVTPNWMCNLPGYAYAGNDADGFLSRDEVVAYLEGYARSINAPVREGVSVTAIEPHNHGYTVKTEQGTYVTPVVVVATSFFEQPKIPAAAANISPSILQLHSSQYKNLAMLPPGAVLVVGSGQSGCQIAEELNQAGRRVYLCTGNTPGFLRRYRSKDGTWWFDQLGMFNRTLDELPSPKAKFAPNPPASGARGGHSINLHRFAHDGIILLGHFKDVQDDHVIVAPDLQEILTRTDKAISDFRQSVDALIQKAGLHFPAPDPSNTDDYAGDEGYHQKEILKLDLRGAGIGTVIWAAGYKADYSFVHLPVLDEDAYPIQQRGVTEYPGLYFVGVHFQHTRKSDLFYGVGEDAQYVVAAIAARRLSVASYINWLWCWCKADGRDKSAPLRLCYAVTAAGSLARRNTSLPSCTSTTI